jgi:flagellar biosynthesis protein FliR
LNRLMPSFQVLFVAMPLQIALALGVIMLSIGTVVELVSALLTSSVAWLDPL